VSADSIVPNPGDPQNLNRYSYVRNSPLNLVNPSGHIDCSLLGDPGDVAACVASKVANLMSKPFNSGAGEHSSHEETHFLHQLAKLTHKGDDVIHAIEGSHAFIHGTEMFHRELGFAQGATYAGQVIVYGTHEAKAAAGLPPYLTHARAATHSGLNPITNPWAAAGKAIRGCGSAVALVLFHTTSQDF